MRTNKKIILVTLGIIFIFCGGLFLTTNITGTFLGTPTCNNTLTQNYLNTPNLANPNNLIDNNLEELKINYDGNEVK